MSTVTNKDGVKIETVISAISLDSIKKSENQKEGTLTAQLRQVRTTKSTYPSKKVASNLQDSLFGAEAFGFEASEPYVSTENRIAWIPVPEKATEVQVKEMLAKANASGACIYRVLSNEPIIDDNQAYAISQGQQTKDQYADRQAVRIPSNEKTIADGTANSLALDANGNVQYRRTFFSSTPKEDMDLRDASKVFVSQTIAAELLGAGQFASQTV